MLCFLCRSVSPETFIKTAACMFKVMCRKSNLLLHVVQDIFEVQVVVVVLDALPDVLLEQLGRLARGNKER